MPREFRPYEPDQGLLLPPSLCDWLPEDHLAFFISDAIDAMDLSAFDARYGDEGPGNQAFDPRMMVKVLVYAYATGTFSSRKIAAKLHEDVALRVLAADNFPAHRTISDFRQRHLPEFQALFVQLVQMAREVGLVKLGTVAVDGSKVKANASKHKAMSYVRMKQEEKRLRQEIRDLTARARKTDAAEDKRYGKEQRGDELPAELARRESRLETIRAARRRLEARQKEEDRRKGREPGDQDRTGKPGKPFKRRFGEPEEKAQENFTDPDSRIMNTKKDGFQQCYNAQIAVDAKEQVIVAAQVGQSAADNRSLLPVIDEVERNTARRPRVVLADSGYKGERNFEGLRERRITGYIPLGREGQAPARQPDPRLRRTQEMRRKMATKRGRDRYRKRKHIAEPPFGWIKECLGFRRFHLRGIEAVRGEWKLMCSALNLRRMGKNWAWT